ncbi:MAG TPA: hypothetical protein VI299_19930, partial [Polyangiales bacterium]
MLTGCGVVALGLILSSVAGLAPLASPTPSLALLVAGAAAAGTVMGRGEQGSRVTVEGPTWLAWSGRGALGVGVLATGVTIVLALWLPVGAYDAIGYRLPAVAQWLDAGGFSWVTGDDPLRNGYPLGLELIEATLFAGFGSPRAVDAVASMFLIAGALALLGFGRRVALPSGAAELAAALFLLVPMHLLNAPSGYADAAFAGAMVCTLIAVARLELGDNAWTDLGIAA